MKNLQIELKNGKIVITIDPAVTHGLSKSGKNIMIASTEGNQKIETQHGEMFLGINAYKKSTEKEQEISDIGKE